MPLLFSSRSLRHPMSHSLFSRARFFVFVLLIAGCSRNSVPSSTASSNSRGNKTDSDSLLFSFVSLGCNRVDQSDLSAANPSTGNLPQLNRTYKDILTLTPTPKFLFFTGDLVLGYTNGDTNILRNELQAWLSIYERSGLEQAGIQLVPVPGNHETLLAKNQPAYAGAEQVWLRLMQPYIRNNNGPRAGQADNLAVDESRLTYSFDYGKTHFILLNTDGVGKESRIPYRWATNDIKQAKTGGANHIFAFSHIPAWGFPGEDDLGAYCQERDTFWTAMEAGHAEVLLSAHNHVYYRTQPDAGKTWQVIAGNGGSRLSSFIKSDSQKFFGFTLVEVYRNGKVLVKSYGRNMPSAGYLADPSGYSTVLKDSLEVTWGK